jgi:hypothetical protein
MGLSVDIWNIDLPEIRVNSGQPPEIAHRHTCRDSRMALGRITNMEDFEKERTRVLSKPLP